MRIDDKSNVGCYDFMKVRQTEEIFAPMQAPGLQESRNIEKWRFPYPQKKKLNPIKDTPLALWHDRLVFPRAKIKYQYPESFLEYRGLGCSCSFCDLLSSRMIQKKKRKRKLFRIMISKDHLWRDSQEPLIVEVIMVVRHSALISLTISM
jgi:hypothetical protein